MTPDPLLTPFRLPCRFSPRFETRSEAWMRVRDADRAPRNPFSWRRGVPGWGVRDADRAPRNPFRDDSGGIGVGRNRCHSGIASPIFDPSSLESRGECVARPPAEEETFAGTCGVVWRPRRKGVGGRFGNDSRPLSGFPPFRLPAQVIPFRPGTLCSEYCRGGVLQGRMTWNQLDSTSADR